jgi:hypothetical protein
VIRTPHFVRLVELDGQHFITACRHGLVHLTWERTTIRFSRDEFRQLAGLLNRASDDLFLASIRDGDLRLTPRLDDDCELQVGSLVLLLSPDEFRKFARAAQEAVQRLDEILASGMWDREEPDEGPTPFLRPTQRNPFSKN